MDYALRKMFVYAICIIIMHPQKLLQPTLPLTLIQTFYSCVHITHHVYGTPAINEYGLLV